MRIHSMTATFGKLEHETLTLEPGLNIIEAPNEWGKSTWCAFLTAMLYGMETRAKTTKSALADKERYLPWSGSPMSGRMELSWNGREITIERATKGRVPLGQFSAYETGTGLPIPELTAANCGQTLLGVEKSVFLRGGFIRLNDMPLTQDEALRARLNALVTTGDESGDAQRLGKALKDLKNRCRYNQSGLLPQAQGERAALEEKLRELDALEEQCAKLTQRRGEVTSWVEDLENHDRHLRYEKAQEDAQRLSQAEQDAREARLRLEKARQDCADALPRDEAEQKLLRLRSLNQQTLDLRMEAQMLPQPPASPEAPAPFRGMTGAEATRKAEEDGRAYQSLERRKAPLLLAAALILAGIALCLWKPMVGGAVLVAGGALGLLFLLQGKKRDARRSEIAAAYGCDDPTLWLEQAKAWAEAEAEGKQRLRAYQDTHADLLSRYETLRQRLTELTQGQDQERIRREWERSLTVWDALSEAAKQADRAEKFLQTVGAMALRVEEPAQPDSLSYSETETARLLSDARGELQQLSNRLSQYQGRMEALGDRSTMEGALERVKARLEKLEDTYAALTIAMETLNQASMELQRRFAPQISRRAQELMSDFTGGRYDRLSMGEDLSLKSGAGEEDTLHDALWRSDGTVDQLYLALRLALAENLTPGAPLVLDDALVRFDDRRLAEAIAVLRREAENRQVILFTCQSREKQCIHHKEENL